MMGGEGDEVHERFKSFIRVIHREKAEKMREGAKVEWLLAMLGPADVYAMLNNNLKIAYYFITLLP